MRKYGVEHFHIELIEETDKPEEREEYWIQQLGTYKYGYNATMGGDGKRYLDYDKIYELYQQGKPIKEIAEICQCCGKQVSKILREKYNVAQEQILIRSKNNRRKSVAMIDITTDKIIKIFSSEAEACLFLGKERQGSRHIWEVCNNKRKTAYGYKWKEIKE